MAQVELTPLSELVDDVWGKKGTPKRDEMEKQLEKEVNSRGLGETVRKDR
jgi:hypothetical protein